MTSLHRHFAVRQRGAASVIVSVLFLVIVGYGAVVMLDMGAGEMHDANLGESDVQAQLLAEAGLERAFYRFKNGTVCTSVACSPSGCPAIDGPYTLGSGQFTVNVAALEGSDCRITVLGQVGNTKATLQGLAKPAWQFVEPMDYTGGGSGAGQFLATWTVTLTSTQGNTGWDNGNNCSTTVCPGSSGESYRMRTNTGTRNQLLEGSANRALPSPLVTTTGMTITTFAGYQKEHSGSTSQAQELSVWLYNSVSLIEEQIWVENTVFSNSGWRSQTSPMVLTAGRTYDRVRIKFKLDEPNLGGNNQIRVWIDEIRISL